MLAIRITRVHTAAALTLATALLGGALLAAGPAAAAPVAGGRYIGLSAELDAINLSVNANGSAVQTFDIAYPPASVLPGCGSGGYYDAATTTSFSLPITNSSCDTGPLETTKEYVWFKGTFGDNGFVSGEFRAGPSGLLVQCTKRDMRWAAVTRTGTAPTIASATYSGTASDNGTVRFTTSSSGLTVASFTLTLPQSYANVTTPAVTLTEGLASWSAMSGSTTVARLRMAVNGAQANGVYTIDRGDPACPPLLGTFTARTGGIATATPAASATATPAAMGGGSGTIITGSVPASGGFGLIVFGGGSVGQLVPATRCPVASMALWVAQSGGFLTYVPGTSITAVNQAFPDAFPDSTTPANTPLIGRCL